MSVTLLLDTLHAELLIVAQYWPASLCEKFEIVIADEVVLELRLNFETSRPSLNHRTVVSVSDVKDTLNSAELPSVSDCGLGWATICGATCRGRQETLAVLLLSSPAKLETTAQYWPA